MNPLTDKELDELLREWSAPRAPETLDRKLFSDATADRWWKWLLSGTIRVPVPVALAGMALVAGLSFAAIKGHQQHTANHQMTLADFRPVRQLKPHIVRSSYENN